jgi:hypothetical protein
MASREADHEARFELLPVGAVVDPFTGGGDPFAGRNGRGSIAMTVEVGPPEKR